MNEETTTKLISELAAKLGTTAEHLWSVLLKQAPISCAFYLAFDALVIVALWVGWRKVLKIKFDEYDEVPKILTYSIFGLVTFICVGAIMSDLPLLLSGFFNPDYWALKQIIK